MNLKNVIRLGFAVGSLPTRPGVLAGGRPGPAGYIALLNSALRQVMTNGLSGVTVSEHLLSALDPEHKSRSDVLILV